MLTAGHTVTRTEARSRVALPAASAWFAPGQSRTEVTE
jgi:hypothetical protein